MPKLSRARGALTSRATHRSAQRQYNASSRPLSRPRRPQRPPRVRPSLWDRPLLQGPRACRLVPPCGRASCTALSTRRAPARAPHPTPQRRSRATGDCGSARAHRALCTATMRAPPRAPGGATARQRLAALCAVLGGSPRACTPAGQLRAAGSPARGRGSRRLAAAVRVRSCGRRAGWPAGQAGPGAGSKEALRGDGCRPRAADSGQGEASSRRDRSRASPPACGSASRTSWFEARERDNGSAADRCTRPRTRRAVRPGVLPSRCSMAQAGQGGQGSVRDRGAPGQAYRLHMPSHRPRGGRIVLACPI